METIGIIGAMEEEISFIKDKMDIITTKKFVNLDFHIGRFLNKNIVLVRSGIGKVNAAICTQAIINQFAADYVINVGIAGAISEQLDIGDIVISSDAEHHDFDVTIYGHKPGQIPNMPETFEADSELIHIAKSAFESIASQNKAYIGRIASGDQFISSKPEKSRISNTFKAMCCEMEGAAIAQAAYLNQIPFVVIRSISDKADESAEMSFDEFLMVSAKNSSLLVEKMIELI